VRRRRQTPGSPPRGLCLLCDDLNKACISQAVFGRMERCVCEWYPRTSSASIGLPFNAGFPSIAGVGATVRTLVTLTKADEAPQITLIASCEKGWH